MGKKIFMLACGSALMFLLSSGALAEEVKKSETKSFSLAFGGSVSVQGDEGFIAVNTWDQPEVKLVMTRRAWGRSQADAEKNLNKLEIRIEASDNHLDIKLIKPKEHQNFSFWDIFDPDTWQENRRWLTVDFELTVPRQCNLKLLNDEGDVTVKSLHGDIAIQVDEGDIRLSDIEFNEINIFVDEGDVEGKNLINPDARLAISVDEGDISLEKIAVRRLQIESDEGAIFAEQLEAKSCSIAVDEGSIELRLSLQEDHSYRLKSDEGTIACYLPPRPDVRLDLETENGRITSDFDVRIRRQGDGQICHDELGSGAALIEARTDEGTIAIRKE